MRCLDGSSWPMKAEMSERMRCADTSGAPTRHGEPVDGCGLMYRAYMETAMNPSSAGRPRGLTLAAAMVPMPLMAMSCAPSALIGGTALNHSTSTRSDSCTTRDQRS